MLRGIKYRFGASFIIVAPIFQKSGAKRRQIPMIPSIACRIFIFSPILMRFVFLDPSLNVVSGGDVEGFCLSLPFPRYKGSKKGPSPKILTFYFKSDFDQLFFNYICFDEYMKKISIDFGYSQPFLNKNGVKWTENELLKHM